MVILAYKISLSCTVRQVLTAVLSSLNSIEGSDLKKRKN
jgi:hypothetical protein